MNILFSRYLGSLFSINVCMSSRMTLIQLLLRYLVSIRCTWTHTLTLLYSEQVMHLRQHSNKTSLTHSPAKEPLQESMMDVSFMVRADSGPKSPHMQTSSYRQLKTIEMISLRMLGADSYEMSSSFLVIFIFDLNCYELIYGPFYFSCRSCRYSAQDVSLSRDMISCQLSYLSNRYESISNSFLIMVLLRGRRCDRAVCLGLKANSSIAYSSKLSNTFEYCWQKPQLYQLQCNLGEVWSPSAPSTAVPPMTSICTLLFFFSFFLPTTLAIRSRLLKTSPGVSFSRWTSSIYFSWQYTALAGYSASLSRCWKVRERRQGLRQNLKVVAQMQNSQAETLIQGRRMKMDRKRSSCFSLNQGTIIGLVVGIIVITNGCMPSIILIRKSKAKNPQYK